MSRRRTTALLFAGIILGSVATASLFHFFSRDVADERVSQQDEEFDSGETEDSEDEPPKAALDERKITGKCVLAGTVLGTEKSSIADALVRVRLLDEPWLYADIPHQARTDKDGRFSVKDLSESLEYQLWAWAPGHAAASRLRVKCKTATEFQLTEEAVLDLSFTKPGGDPAGVVRLQLAGSALWPAREAVTNSEGALTISGLDAGEYVIWASADGLAYISDEPIRLEQGKETLAEIELAPAGEGRVIARDTSGVALTGETTVMVGPSSTALLYRAASMDKTGAAVAKDLPPGNYTASVLAEGYVQTDPVPLSAGDDVVVRLEAGATVSGNVRTAGGQAVSGASLRVDRNLGRTIVALPAGRGRSFRERILKAARGGWPELYQVSKDEIIAGPLLMPLPKTRHRDTRKTKPVWQLSDSKGRFLMDSLPSGRVSIAARHPEFVMFQGAELTLEPGGDVRNVVVLMRRGSALKVRTVNNQGYPVRDAEIAVYDSSDEPLATAVSASDGFATLTGLPGRFRIEATAEDRVPAAARVEGKTGVSTEMEIVLPAADKFLDGRVTDRNGYGVAGATIMARALTRGLIQILTTQTGADGTFALEGAGSGAYLVAVDAGGKGRSQASGVTFEDKIKIVLNAGGAAGRNPGSWTPKAFDEAAGAIPVIAGGSSPGSSIDPLPVKSSGPQPVERTDPLPVEPTGPPIVEPTYATDNLGVTGQDTEEDDDDEQQQQRTLGTIETRFGPADELPVTGPPSGKGGLPISIGGSPGKVIVTQVRSGSRVAVAGLSTGDQIIEIDGRKVSGPAMARNAIFGTIGTVVMIKVKSAATSEVFNVVVQRIRVRAK
ncbi:MAG: hypothetical protein GY854_30030 [Deltaproteobacteria bacterium]|nr:hypothetical protein [Deltaproteobacteria bacterium]